MDDSKIVLAHGGGGILTRELLDEIILPALGKNETALPDAAPVPGSGEMLFTTDSFVVKPLFFRGGDIGRLAVHGTVNDLAVSGAEPRALSVALILEEGLEVEIVRRVVQSIAAASSEAGVQVVTGDTKVVARGEADQMFVTTAGVGFRKINVSPAGLKPGDCVLLSGNIADHGVAVMSERKGIAFETPVVSDSASVWPMVKALIDAGIEVHAMRDPTRGGLAACCVELAADSGVTVKLNETCIPVRPEVRAACEMFGLDPLNVANEGKLVAAVPEHEAERALAILRSLPSGSAAAIVGRVEERRSAKVTMKTRYGGERIVEMPYGEDLPRIC